MMRPQALGVRPRTPSPLTVAMTSIGRNRRVVLSWVDNSLNETSFTVERAASIAGPWTTLAELPPNTTAYTETIANTLVYVYRVFASNRIGDTAIYAASLGFPTETMVSEFSNTVIVGPVPAVPSPVTAVVVREGRNARVRLHWTNVANETGYAIQRATNSTFTTNLVTYNVGADMTTFTTEYLTRGIPYYFRVQAVNAVGASAWANATPFPITP